MMYCKYPEMFLTFFLNFMITDKLTVKVNYILDAPKNGKFNFDIIIHKNFENRTKNTKDMGEICQNIKIAKNFVS